MKKLIFLFLFFFLQFTLAQDYSKIDAIVSKYPKKFSSIERLAQRISKDFETNEDKARALFFWIATNIRYDHYALSKGINYYDSIKIKTFKSQEDYTQQKDYRYAKLVLTRSKAKCHGFALLYKYVANEMNIECEKISGFTKQSISKIGKIAIKTDHAWNAIKVNNKWELIDVTWANNDHSKNASLKFSDEYFFTKPEHFILTHFPKEKKWQILKNNITKKVFYFWPVFYDSYFDSGIKINRFQKGLIKINSKKNIKLNFTELDTTKRFSYKFNNQKYSTDLMFKKVKNSYSVEIPLPKKRPRSIILFSERYGIMEFKLIP